MKKGILWTFLSIFLLVGVFYCFSGPIITMACKQMLAPYIPGAQISVRDFRWQMGKCLLKDFVISVDEERYVCVENVECDLEMQSNPLRIRPKVSLNGVDVYMRASSQKVKKLPAIDKMFSGKKLIDFVIAKGTLHFAEEELDCPFTLEPSSHLGHLATLRLDRDSVLIDFFSRDRQQYGKISFSGADVGLFGKRAVYMHPSVRLPITEGKVNGTVELGVRQKKVLAHFRSTLTGEALKGDAFAAEKISVRVNLAEEHVNTLSLKEIDIKKMLSCFTTMCEIKGGAFSVENPKTKKQWKFAKFDGRLNGRELHFPTFKGSGILLFEGEGLPAELTAHMEVGDELFLSCGIDFRGHKDGGTVSAGFTIGEKARQFSCDITELSGLELLMAQDVAGFFTTLPFQLDKGIIMGSFQGVCEGGKILAADVHSFDLRSAGGKYGENPFFIENIHGSGSYHFTGPVKSDVRIHGASFTTPAGEMEYLKGFIKTQDVEFYDTSLWGRWDGVKFATQIGGTFSDALVHLECSPKKKNPFQETWDRAKQNCPDLAPIKELVADLRIKDLHVGWQSDGVFRFIFTDASVDEIDYEVITSCDTLSALFENPEISGSFSGKKIGHNLYGVLLSGLQDEWKVQGKMDIRGEFEERGLALTIDPMQQIDIDNSDFHIALALARHPASFYWDFSRGDWSGRLPIQKAAFFQKETGLHIENISANVELKGQSLEARNIRGISDGVALGGYLTVDFSENAHGDVNIGIDAVDGTAENVVTLLRHFEPLTDLDLPIDGRVIQGGTSWIAIHEGNVDCGFFVKMASGTIALSDGLKARNIGFSLGWESHTGIIEITDFEGKLQPQTGPEYQIGAKYFRCVDTENLRWEFDLRSYSSTFEILRLVGTGQKEGDLFEVSLDPEYTHLYRGKIHADRLALTKDFEPVIFGCHTEMEITELSNAIDFLGSAGAIPFKEQIIERIAAAQMKGDVAIDYFVDLEKKRTNIDLAGKGAPLRFVCDKTENSIDIKGFRFGEIEGGASLSRNERQWSVKTLYAKYGTSTIQCTEGYVDEESLECRLGLKALQIDLAALRGALPSFDAPQLQHVYGLVDIEGDLSLSLADKTVGKAECSFHCGAFGPGKTRIKTRMPFTVNFGPQKNLTFSAIKLQCLESHDDDIWCNVDVGSFNINISDEKIEGKNIKVVLPPEIAKHIVDSGYIPGGKVVDGTIYFGDVPVVWENQLACEFDCTFSGGVFKAHGMLQEGYYWIGDRSWLLKDFAFNFYGDRLRLTSQVQIADFTFDLSSVVSFGSEVTGQISAAENAQREDLRPLAVFFRWSHDGGLILQGVEGTLHGLSFDLHRNPRTYLPGQKILSGTVSVDSIGLTSILPTELKHQLKKLGVGKGYELSGDFIFNLDRLHDVRFKGFLKGRDFELFGYQLKTLLSDLEMSQQLIVLRDLRLSDEGGAVNAKEVRISYTQEEGWALSIPEVIAQDFRPSLLTRSSEARGPLRPFVIKDLHFCNIEGKVGDLSTFTGRGYLNFMNTFKRDFHLLDIPLDIIGRLGLDLGLFVPVKGRVDYQMRSGKIFLTGLTESYSDGERSKFYFPDNKEVYIGLDGSLFVDIKMKQYVLLKITEPFTLSIRGSLIKPRYSLK